MDCAPLTALPAQDQALAYWLGRPVPRYTSYPPATAFHADISATQYRESVARLAHDPKISIYLHIPFCHELCLYCGCNTGVTHRAERMNIYLDSLKREIANTASRINGRARLSSIHFGGGTPNMLSPAQLETLFATIHQHFDLLPDCEIAMEIDPRQCSDEQAQHIASLGVNRVSLGVQDFNPQVQELVNRIQPYDMVAKAHAAFHQAGIQSINYDLMYGLPLQTVESVRQSAEMVALLKPQRIALFSYAHVPQFKKHQRAIETEPLPDQHMKLAMDDAARRVFKDNGFSPIGIDHFAQESDSLLASYRSGKMRRNFQGYTTDEEPVLLAFGASSISRTPDGYFQNQRETANYIKDVETNGRSITRGILFTPEDKIRGAIIEQLMCFLKCDIAKICQEYGHAPEHMDAALPALDEMEAVDLIKRHGRSIELNVPHPMAIRVVCRAFDAYALSPLASKAA